jgi:proline-specific peptidase
MGVASVEGFTPFREYRTYFRAFGDLSSGRVPLVALHGQPCTSDSLADLIPLAERGRPLVVYDQLGHGRSDRPEDESIWSLDLYIEEITALREGLGLERVHLLGHSFGGFIALEYALDRPPGLVSLIPVATYPTIKGGQEAREEYLRRVSPDIVAVRERHEAAGTTDSPEYAAANDEFLRRHMVHQQPVPEHLVRGMQGSNPLPSRLLWERDQRHAPGGMGNWDVRPHLHEIIAPTLVVAGGMDALVPDGGRALREGIPGAELVEFEDGAHYMFADEPERFFDAIEDFMQRTEHAIT